MKMNIVKQEKKLCTCCMEVHEVKTILFRKTMLFKEQMVEFDAIAFYCDEAEELYTDEQQMKQNDTAMKDAYRSKMGLLTSEEIVKLRSAYGITQSDLCMLLGWGLKTITRYESHQVQDRAHDTILRKLAQDPEWFLTLLYTAKDSFSEAVYRKYFEKATALYEKSQDQYLRKAIEAKYARFQEHIEYQGNTVLSLDKVIAVIRYFAASSLVTNLYKVKLMKLLWYSDALSYKKRGQAITGLVYCALPMGAVPIAHESIIELQGVPCEEVDMGEGVAYHFFLPEKEKSKALEAADLEILDEVIWKLGKATTNEIVAFMHQEEAYKQTARKDIISFRYAETLRI